MAMDRVFFKKRILLNESGQSMVEYILLIAVIVSLVSIFFKSPLFQGYFGNDGKLSQAFKGKLEYTYTHAVDGKEFYRTPNYNSHDSYRGRFFSAKELYPK
jgi:Flp pilus assembly pilin Flp